MAIEESQNESENLRGRITALKKEVKRLQQIDKLRAEQVLKLTNYIKSMEKNQQMPQTFVCYIALARKSKWDVLSSKKIRSRSAQQWNIPPQYAKILEKTAERYISRWRRLPAISSVAKVNVAFKFNVTKRWTNLREDRRPSITLHTQPFCV